MYPEITIFHYQLESYVACYVIAFLVAALLLRRELKNNNYPSSLFVTLMVVGMAAGIVGGKIYYVLSIWDDFVLSPLETFFNFGGLGWYGGFVLGAMAIVLVLKMKSLPVLKTLDTMIPIVPLSQAFGRLGCFLAGCCHGVPTHVPWAIPFQDGMYQAHVKVHPTQLYEMSLCLCLFVLLWKLRRVEMKEGQKVGLYLVFAGLARFVVEFYRLSPETRILLTVPQILALVSTMLGVLIIILRRKSYNP